MTGNRIKQLAAASGFELAGIAPVQPPPAEFHRYRAWVDAGQAGTMRYLTDHRADLRQDARHLLPEAQSIVCVGKLYRGPEPDSPTRPLAELGWISRYAWGEDYHDVLRRDLERLAERILAETAAPLRWRACVDTAPLLERSLARQAGLGWIGRNTCLISQQHGSWFFLGELLLSLPLAPDQPPPDRCGTCTRCIDACPTQALVPAGDGTTTLDARLCLSYLTIENRGATPVSLRPLAGRHVFGCDICQDVCPWNSRASLTVEPAFTPRDDLFYPPLEKLAALSHDEFRQLFRRTPVTRARYAGFLRNVAVAMGNSRQPQFRQPLERLAAHPDPLVAEHAAWALAQLP